MSNINHVTISGNLTRDPDLRSTHSGTPVLSFGVAINEKRKNQRTEEWEDYPNFVECTLFGNYGIWLSENIHIGDKVSIEGKLRWSEWEKDGQKRSKLEVIASNIDLMGNQKYKTKGYAEELGSCYDAAVIEEQSLRSF